MPEMRHGRNLDSTEHRTKDPVVRPKESQGQPCRLLSLQETAIVLGISSASVRRLVWSRRLPAVRILRRIQIDLRDIDQFIERFKQR